MSNGIKRTISVNTGRQTVGGTCRCTTHSPCTDEGPQQHLPVQTMRQDQSMHSGGSAIATSPHFVPVHITCKSVCHSCETTCRNHIYHRRPFRGLVAFVFFKRGTLYSCRIPLGVVNGKRQWGGMFIGASNASSAAVADCGLTCPLLFWEPSATLSDPSPTLGPGPSCLCENANLPGTRRKLGPETTVPRLQVVCAGL